jgi:hypothetical protein
MPLLRDMGKKGKSRAESRDDLGSKITEALRGASRNTALPVVDSLVVLQTCCQTS